MASDLPFWDDANLNLNLNLNISGGLDGDAPMPPLTRSLFDNDLFCDEAGPDDALPPLSPSLLPHPPTSTSPSFGAMDIDTTPKPSSTSSLSKPRWQSFLDDACPLRRRVKVTIVPSPPSANSKQYPQLATPPPPAAVVATPDTASSVVGKPRHSHARVSAPRRALVQTTFRTHASAPSLDRRFPCPSKRRAASPAGGATQPKREKVVHVREDAQGKLGIELHSEHSHEVEQRKEEDVQVVTGEDPMVYDYESMPVISPTTSTSDSLSDDTASTSSDDSKARPAHKRFRKSGTGGAARKARRKMPSFITASLQNRLSSMLVADDENSPPSKHLNLVSDHQQPFPLVDAAVQAISNAAREYSSKLACSFPVASSATLSIVNALPPASRKGKKIAGGRRCRRTLLSFDDRDVKPLLSDVEDTDKNSSTESVLAGFLNCSSPCSRTFASRL